MEIGSEISQKIRSAIKAKLLELGAYVDDELPEYIMVMVANKRSRAQMNNDLCLFLGDNTDSFTEWLHNLLVKLQTIKADSDKSVDKQVKVERLNAIKEKRKGKKLLKGDQPEKNNLKNKKNVNDSLVSGEAEGIVTKRRKVTSYGVSEIKDAREETQSDGNNEDVEHSLHRAHSRETNTSNTPDCLVNSKDNLICGSSKNMQGVDNRQLLVHETSRETLAEQIKTEIEFVNSRNIDELSVIKSTVLKKGESSSTVTTNCQSSTRQLPSPDRHLQLLTVVRKRKASTSVQDASKDGDETYDPYNPAVVPVANSAKITKRRSSVPASLRTNRQIDSSASEEMIHVNQSCIRDLQEQYGQPQHKLVKVSDTVNLEDIKQALADVLERTRVQTDDISHFSRMLELSLRKLRPQDLSLAKLRIQQVLFEFESVAAQENVVESEHNKNKFEQVENIEALRKVPGVGSSNSLSIDLPKGNHHTLSLSTSTCETLLNQKDRHNLENDHRHSVLPNQQVDSTERSRQQKTSGNIENHVATIYTCVNSERHNSDIKSSHTNRVISHPKSALELLKTSATFETVDYNSRSQDSVMKSRERDSVGLKPQGDQPPQSPVFLGKADMGSPSSAHSSPLGSSSGLVVKRHVTSASRESTLSPLDLQSKPGTSHIHKHKLASADSKLSPSILVDSIHSRKRPESSESSSVLRQSWQRDKSPRAAEQTKNETQDSPKHYGPEALKVMAKNLRITVINKSAVKSQHQSSSDDSDDDEDFDSSDDDEEDEEKDSDSTERMKDGTPLNKSSSGPSTP